MKVEELKIGECLDILERTTLGRLACSVEDQPYIVPFNFAFDGKEYLYAFSTVGQKIHFLIKRKQDPLCLFWKECV